MTNSIPFRERIACSIQEACVALGVGKTKLGEEIRAGRLETTKLGGRRLVKVQSLLKLAEEGTEGRAA